MAVIIKGAATRAVLALDLTAHRRRILILTALTFAAMC